MCRKKNRPLGLARKTRVPCRCCTKILDNRNANKKSLDSQKRQAPSSYFVRAGVGLMNAGPSSAPEKTVEFIVPPPPPAPSAPPQSASIAPYGTKFFGVEDFFGGRPSGDKVESGAEEKDLDLDLKL